MSKYPQRPLDDYLIAGNLLDVRTAARKITVIDVSNGPNRKVVIPIVANGDVLREATLELLSDETYGKYDLFKVKGQCQFSDFEGGVVYLVGEFLSDDRASWSAYRRVAEPDFGGADRNARQVEWARSPNVAQGSIDVCFDKVVCFGDGRPNLAAEEGKAYMQVTSDHVIPVKTFLTSAEVKYIGRLQKGE